MLNPVLRTVGGGLVLVGFACTATGALAQQGGTALPTWLESTLGNVSGAVGVMGTYGPDYEGSDDYEAGALPMLDLNVADIAFLRGTSAGLNLVTIKGQGPRDALRLGPIVRYDFGRDEDDNDALRGLGDVDGSIEAGGFLSYDVGPFGLGAEVRFDAGDGHEGMIAELSASYSMQPTDRVFVSFGVGTSYADDDYMSSFFGIDTAQAARSVYDTFDAGAGFKDVSATVTTGYAFTQRIRGLAILGAAQLLGDAADSPIVDDAGSATQFRAMLGLSYSF